MKSALIGPWEGNNTGAPQAKQDAAANKPATAWRPAESRMGESKWPEKDRTDFNAGARDRPAQAGRWRERDEDPRDRNWEADR